MNHDGLKILKDFSRKILNSRFQIAPKTLIEQLKNGEFGYVEESDSERVLMDDSILVNDFLIVIDHIKSIFRAPSISLKKENVVQNVEGASKFDNATLRATLADERLWRLSGGTPSPEYIHGFVYEENLAIYENRFVCYVIDLLYEEVCKKITEIASSIETLNEQMGQNGVQDFTFDNYVDYMLDTMPILVTDESATVSVLKKWVKTKRILTSLRSREIYRVCKKEGAFNPRSLKPTNLLLKNEDYRPVYKFYLDYFVRETDKTELDKIYLGYVTVNLMGALDELGFVLNEDNADVRITNTGVLRFDAVTFTKSPFQITLSQKGEDGVLFTVKEIFDGSVAKYLFRAVNEVRAKRLSDFTSLDELINSCENTDGIFRTFIVNDIQPLQRFQALYVLPEAEGTFEVLSKAIKSCLLLAFGSSFMHDRYCAVCGSTLLSKGEDIACTACGSVYHIFEDDGIDYIWFKDLPKQVLTPQEEPAPVEEEPAPIEEEPTPIEEPAPVEEAPAPIEEDPVLEEVAVADYERIRRSFMQKLCASTMEVQGYYNEIKHELLCFQKVRSRVSFSFDRFNLGRKTVAILGIRGKTLVLYLALDPNEYADTKYFPKNVADVKKYEDTPMMVKVKSQRGVKFAIELINKMLEGVPKNLDLEMLDYVQPEIPAEDLVGSYLKKSFVGKLCQLDRGVQGYYSIVKNALVSYKKVNSRLSFNYDSFNCGRKTVARFNVRGKTLVLFLALNPADYADSKYFPKDFSDVKKYEDTPMMVKVKSERGVKYAIELIDKMLEGMKKETDFEPTTFYEPYKSDAQLLKNGLAKLVKRNSSFIR